MAITKTFSISLENNASMMPICGGQYKEVFINFDLPTLFERVDKATLYLCIPNIISSTAQFLLYDDGDITNFIDFALVESDNNYSYLKFDVTRFVKYYPSGSHVFYVRNNYSSSSSDFESIFASLSRLEVEYEQPFDHLNNQQLNNNQLGHSFLYDFDLVTFNTYISKSLFEKALNIDLSLVYDFISPNSNFHTVFPKGWKLNILEKLSINNNDNEITFIDERYNRHLFKQISDLNIYYDTSGTGLIIEKTTIENSLFYKLYSPLNSSHKLFFLNGYIKKIVLEDNREINIDYTQDEITITDYRDVIITISKQSNTLVTISANVVSQTYQLNLNNSDELSSLSFQSLSSSETLLEDTFSYDGRLTNIYTFDNYHLNINTTTYIVIFSKYFNNNLFEHIKYEYNYSNIVISNLINEYSERCFFDEENKIITSGRNSGNLNQEDQLFYFDKTFNFYSQKFAKEDAVHLSFIESNGAYTHNMINDVSNQVDATTSPFNVDAGTYLFIFKIKPLTKIESTINHPGRGIILTCPQVSGSVPLLAINSFDEQYYFYSRSFDNPNNNLFFKFTTSQYNCNLEISNAYLIKVNNNASSLMYLMGSFNGFNNETVFLSTNGVTYYSSVDEPHYLFIQDIHVNQLLKYKYGYVKYFFTENLTKLFIFDNNNSPYVYCGGDNVLFSNLTFGVRQQLSFLSNTISAITSASNSTNYIVSSVKEVFTIDAVPPFIHRHRYISNQTYDYHGNLLNSTNPYGLLETNTYNNHLLTAHSLSYDSKYITSNYSYDTKRRIIQTSNLVGQQLVNKSYQYAHNKLAHVSSIVDENSLTTNYLYSSNYEYTRTIKRAVTPFLSYFTHLELDDSFRNDKLQSPSGDYRFEYNSQRNDLSKIYFHHNTFDMAIAPSSIGGQNDIQFVPITTNDFVTNLITLNYSYYSDGSCIQYINYANNYTYRKEIDNLSRLIKIYDSDSLFYEIQYDGDDARSNISIIYDDSGYEDETVAFTYLKDKVSSITYNSSFSLEFTYDNDIYNRLSSKIQIIKQNNSVLSGFSKIKTTYNYDDIDDSISSINIDLFLKEMSLTTPTKTIDCSIVKDPFSRVTSSLTSVGNYSLGFSSINYFTQVNYRTCYQIESATHIVNNDIESFTYDGVGNILSSSVNSSSVTYQYDDLNRLIREEHQSDNYYIEYTYSYDGNILTAKKKNLITNSVIKSDAYSYDSKMPFKLSSFNNVNITYDNFLNPLSLNGYSFTYYRGNKLRTSNDGFVTTTYNYFGNGLRSSKQVGSKLIRYFYEKDKLVKEIQTDNNITNTINYLYGINGIIGFTYNQDLYLYDKNIFNDVIAIYKCNSDNSLTLMAKYSYDAYGNHQVLNPNGTSNTSSSFIGNINPIRYRSYYFDSETGFYYCKSRYYVPYLRRWLTMDSLSYLDKEDMQGTNLFAYCKNNPVMYTDESGQMPEWAYWVIGIGVIALLAVATVVTAGIAGVGIGTAFGAGFAGAAIGAGASGAVVTIASSAFAGAVIGAGMGMISGALYGGLSTLSLSGALSGAGKGFMWGSILGAISGSLRGGISYAKTVPLFRSVSNEEAVYIVKNGKFSGAGIAMEDKWFSTTKVGAERWANFFNQSTFVGIRVPKSSLLNAYYAFQDTYAEAYCFNADLLNSILSGYWIY